MEQAATGPAPELEFVEDTTASAASDKRRRSEQRVNPCFMEWSRVDKSELSLLCSLRGFQFNQVHTDRIESVAALCHGGRAFAGQLEKGNDHYLETERYLKEIWKIAWILGEPATFSGWETVFIIA